MIQQIILPWDGEHHEKAVNTTPADMMRTKFPNVAVLAKSNKVWKIPGSRQGDYDIITDIQQVRIQMSNMVIHGNLVELDTEEGSNPARPDHGNCQWLLECLENYKYEFNNKLQMWTEKPLHDKHSHMADALRYGVQATKELEFFGGQFFQQQGGVPTGSVDYEQDYSGVW